MTRRQTKQAAAQKVEPASVLLTLTGDLTVRTVRELADRLREAIEKAPLVRLRFGPVDAVDVSFVQVICAAHRAALIRGGDLRIEGDLPRAVVRFQSEIPRCREGEARDAACVWGGRR